MKWIVYGMGSLFLPHFKIVFRFFLFTTKRAFDRSKHAHSKYVYQTHDRIWYQCKIVFSYNGLDLLLFVSKSAEIQMFNRSLSIIQYVRLLPPDWLSKKTHKGAHDLKLHQIIHSRFHLRVKICVLALHHSLIQLAFVGILAYTST